MNFIVIIPARFGSTRLPGKPLINIAGKPMIAHVIDRSNESGANRVIVATDHFGVKAAVEHVNGEVCLTRSEHNSGTERLAEVIEHYKFPDNQIIVNVQGDEPLIPPEIITQVATNLAKSNVGMATLAVPITDVEDAFNPNIVKVLMDRNGHAIYFSRATIPWERTRFMKNKNDIGQFYLRHIGIYAYRAGFIRRYVNWQPSQLEQIEMLEQLRVLWYGEKIHVDVAKKTPGIGVDTKEDLIRINEMMK